MVSGCDWLEDLFGGGGEEGIAACLGFNAFTTGTTYNVGDTFTLQGINITVLPFEWTSRSTTNAGHALVTATTNAGGSSPEINLNNVNLGFDFSGSIQTLDLNFIDMGGNCNIQTNTNFVNTPDFTGLGLPGISINVTAGIGTPGAVKLQGQMNPEAYFPDPTLGIFAFVIVGQELWIDDLCSGI